MNMLRQRLRGYILEAGLWLRLQWKLRAVEEQYPILVHQMGKVGSSTVVRTLQEMDRPEPILQVHTLDPEHLGQAIDKQRASQSSLPEHLITSSIIVRKLQQGVFPCRIITLTREPVARIISFVFEDWQKMVPRARCSGGGMDVERMMRAVDNVFENGAGHVDPSRWFDREVKGVFGVDVFSEPYSREQGYSILHDGKVSVLVLRLEDLSCSLPGALATFLDVDPQEVVISSANVGDKKWYADALQTVKKRYQLSPKRARSVVNTRYFQHFYAKDRERIWSRWTSDVA